MIQNCNKIGSMNELDSKNPISFTKRVKQTVRKGQHQIQTRDHCLKPHSTSKSNISKFSQNSQSKEKKHPALHALRAQKSPYYNDGNNAKSERCDTNNEENMKFANPNDCWSIETSVQTKTISKTQDNIEFRYIRKERSCRDIEKFDKKDRKFSENVHRVVNDFENLKEEHHLQKKLMEMVLNEKQLHRLNKIYAVEEAQYMIRILNAEKTEKK